LKQKYLITIDGLQMLGWDKNVTLTTLGEFRKEDDRYFISYNNFNYENNIDDITLLEVDADKRVVFTRNGENSSHLVIERDQTNYSHYRTDYGDAMLGVRANKIMNDLDNAGGRLSLSYALNLNANELFQQDLIITVKEI